MALDRNSSLLGDPFFKIVLFLDVKKHMVHCVFMDRFAGYVKQLQAVNKVVTELGLNHGHYVVIMGSGARASILAAKVQKHTGKS